MGLVREECWRRGWRSTWLGHQSRLVLGRWSAGVGDGSTGFSLSLPRSDTSVALLSVVFVRRVGGRRVDAHRRPAGVAGGAADAPAGGPSHDARHRRLHPGKLPRSLERVKSENPYSFG